MARVKIDMTSGNIPRQLMKLSLPIMLTSVLQLLFNTADTIVVGRWGGATPEACERALAAVSSCTSLISLIVALFMGLSVGAGVIVSHGVGEKNYLKIEKTVHTAITIAVICGVAISTIGFIFARHLLMALGTNEVVLDQAVLYMRAYFCGVPAHLVYSYCAAMLRSTGETTKPLFFLSVAGVANVLLNLVMVIIFEAGALGVGVATAASHWISCFMIIIYMLTNDGPCRFDPRKLCVDVFITKKVFSIGIPAGVQSAMFGIGNVLLQGAINSFQSTVILSGSSIATNIGSYAQLSVAAINQSTQVFVGQNAGARNMKRIKKGVGVSVVLVTVLGISSSLLLILFSKPLCELYAPDNPAVVEFARQKMLVVASCYFIGQLEQVPAVAMRGLGKSFVPMAVSILGICGVRILWIYTVFAMFPDPLVLFAVYGVSWTISGIAQFIAYGITRRRISRQWRMEKIENAAFQQI